MLIHVRSIDGLFRPDKGYLKSQCIGLYGILYRCCNIYWLQSIIMFWWVGIVYLDYRGDMYIGINSTRQSFIKRELQILSLPRTAKLDQVPSYAVVVVEFIYVKTFLNNTI